jgi:hypothetical protein
MGGGDVRVARAAQLPGSEVVGEEQDDAAAGTRLGRGHVAGGRRAGDEEQEWAEVSDAAHGRGA